MPNMRPRWAFDQFPFIAKQQIKIAVIPLCWISGPRALDTAGDGVAAFT